MILTIEDAATSQLNANKTTEETPRPVVKSLGWIASRIWSHTEEMADADLTSFKGLL